MKKWMKILGALAVIGILALLYVWFFVYNKPHRDFEKADPDHILAAEQLYFSFSQDKALSDSLYTGMVVQVYGPLGMVEKMDTTHVVVYVFGQGMFGDEGIRCYMLPNQEEGLDGFSPGDMITVKGYCTGYNDTDVILEKGSLVK